MDPGLKVLKLRKRLKWSQAKLAARCGVHQTIVSKWEVGDLEIAPRSLGEVAEALGVGVEELQE
jgi:transcriptional regulator with XRE-family HTH domain